MKKLKISLLIVVSLAVIMVAGVASMAYFRYGITPSEIVEIVVTEFGYRFIPVKVPKAKYYGVDVSKFQLAICWSSVKSNESLPISFAYAKATEGRDHTDYMYGYNARHARSAGLRFGAYHVLRMSDVERQVASFYETASLQKGDLVPMVDLEECVTTDKGYSYAAIQNKLVDVVQLMDKKYGCKIIIYGSRHMIRNVVQPTGLHKNHIIWRAAPHGGFVGSNEILQFSWNGNVSGIPFRVDLDATNIDLKNITLK